MLLLNLKTAAQRPPASAFPAQPFISIFLRTLQQRLLFAISFSFNSFHTLGPKAGGASSTSLTAKHFETRCAHPFFPALQSISTRIACPQ
jgi:hypothetical protein